MLPAGSLIDTVPEDTVLITLRITSLAGVLLAATSLGALAQTTNGTPTTTVAPPVTGGTSAAPSMNRGTPSDINQNAAQGGAVTGPQAVAPDTKPAQTSSSKEH